MARQKNTTYVSICISLLEKKLLDEAVAKAGTNRNRFIRNWIDTLATKK